MAMVHLYTRNTERTTPEGASRLDDQGHRNWILGTLALFYIKEGLETFIHNKSTLFHHQLVQLCGGPTLAPCTAGCTSDSIKRDLRNRRWCMECPVCDAFLQQAISFHRMAPLPNLATNNLHPQLWFTVPWEVMKIYMPAGHRADQSAKDADILGILSLLTNCNHSLLHNHIGRKDLLHELQAIRNALFHSGSHSYSDADVRNLCQTVIDFLNGMTGLTSDENTSVREAVRKVQELQTNKPDFPLNKELEMRTLKLKLDALETDLIGLKDDMNKQDKQTARIMQLEKAAGRVKAIQEEFEEFLEENDLSQEISRPSARLGTLQQEGASSKPVVLSTETSALKVDVRGLPQSSVEQYKCELVEHYMKTCLEIKSGPNSDRLLYVDPEIRVLRERTHENRLKKVEGPKTGISCSKIFFTTNGHRCRQIYITGDAGCGKSMVCIYMVRLWCEAHSCNLSNESEDSDSDSEEDWERRRETHSERQVRRKENKQIMSDFSILLYITLRDCFSANSLTEMILSQILQHHDSMKDINVALLLENERCLVILDGLDEWVCPQGRTISDLLNTGLNPVNKTTFLVTMRPWKLNELQQENSVVDKHVELCEMSEKCASQLTSKVIKSLTNSQFREKKKTFFRTLRKEGLDYMKTAPLILKHLVYLWLDKRDLGNSKVQVFCSMLDFLLKNAKINESEQTAQTTENVPLLPDCVLKLPNCSKHHKLIYCISRLAFEALFNVTKENSLVFDCSHAEKIGLGQESLNTCLIAGILSENKLLVENPVCAKKMSFLHKVFQEFLAAIFIVSSDDVQGVFSRITGFCHSLDTCSEMSQVLLFVSGMSSDITKQWLDHFTKVVTASKQLQNYRQKLLGEDLVQDIQLCLTNCDEEGGRNGFSYDISLEDLYINHGTVQHMEHLLCSHSSKVKSLSIHTYGIDRNQFRTMTEHLQKCNSVQKLYVWVDFHSSISSCKVEDMVHTLSTSLTCLHLQGITATEKLVAAINTIKFFKALGLHDINMTHENQESILKRISHSHSLSELLLELKCTDHRSKCSQMIDLFKMKQLQSLELCDMFVSNLPEIADCANEVNLRWVTLPVQSLNEFIQGTIEANRGVQLRITGATVLEPDDKTTTLEDFLQLCHRLKLRQCHYNHISHTWDINCDTNSQ